jgi:hypothetical protein
MPPSGSTGHSGKVEELAGFVDFAGYASDFGNGGAAE